MRTAYRKMDGNGRVRLPKEFCQLLNLQIADYIALIPAPKKRRIYIQKISPTCICCGQKHDLIPYQNKLICRKCKTILDHILGAPECKITYVQAVDLNGKIAIPKNIWYQFGIQPGLYLEFMGYPDKYACIRIGQRAPSYLNKAGGAK